MVVAIVGLLYLVRTSIVVADEANVPPSLRGEQPWQRASACGANCLYLLLRYNGISVDHGRLIQQMSPKETGNTLYDLKSHARAHGLSVSVFRSSDPAPKGLRFPFIAHIDSTRGIDHFVLVCRVDEDSVSFVDGTTLTPAKVTKGTFFRNWSGYVVGTKSSDFGTIGQALSVSLVVAFLAASTILFLGPGKSDRANSR